MLTAIRGCDNERVMTVQIDEPVMDAEVVSALASVLDDVEDGAIENLVVRFCGGSGSIAGDFPSWGLDPVRSDIRFFARWDETLSRISRLKAKTFAAYDGRVGAAAVHLGLVTDLRLASAHARLALGNLADGRFPGMAAYWLPKFVGLGTARKIFLIGEDLPADRASEVGLVDVVEDTVDAAVDATLEATRPVTPRRRTSPAEFSTTAIRWSIPPRSRWPRRLDTSWECPQQEVSLTLRSALEGASHDRDPQPQFAQDRHGLRERPSLLDRGRTRLRLHRVDRPPSGRSNVVHPNPGARHQRLAPHLSSRAGRAAEDAREVRDQRT